MKPRKKRKYLNDLGTAGTCLDVEKCGRGDKWKKQRAKYGFDERDTWSLDSTMIDFLYERAMMFKEVNCVDLTFHKIEINGEVKTQQEWVDELLENCRKAIMEDGFIDDYKHEARVWEIWKEIHGYMWW